MAKGIRYTEEFKRFADGGVASQTNIKGDCSF